MVPTERSCQDKHDGSKDVADKDKDAKDAEKDGSKQPGGGNAIIRPK